MCEHCLANSIIFSIGWPHQNQIKHHEYFSKESPLSLSFIDVHLGYCPFCLVSLRTNDVKCFCQIVYFPLCLHIIIMFRALHKAIVFRTTYFRSDITTKSLNSLDPDQHIAFAHSVPADWTEQIINKKLDASNKFVQRIQILKDRLGKPTGNVVFHFDSQQKCLDFVKLYNQQFVKTDGGDGVHKMYMRSFNLKKQSEQIEETKYIVRLSNLEKSLVAQNIKKMAEDFGKVTSVIMPMDIDGNNKTFAFVYFENPKAANDFREFIDGLNFLGRTIKAAIAKPRVQITKGQERERDKNQKVEIPKKFMRKNKELMRENEKKQAYKIQTEDHL